MVSGDWGSRKMTARRLFFESSCLALLFFHRLRRLVLAVLMRLPCAEPVFDVPHAMEIQPGNNKDGEKIKNDITKENSLRPILVSKNTPRILRIFTQGSQEEITYIVAPLVRVVDIK